MLGSDGRESVQVVYMGQDTGVKMKVPTATTTTTVMLHKQTCEGGDNSQRGGAFDSHDATVVNTSYRSSQVPHYSPTQRPLPTTTPEGRIADSGMENSVGGVGQSVDEMCPGNTGGGDDLTSLSWLHSLDMGGMVPHLATPPTPPASPQPHNPLYPMLTSHTSPMDRKRKLEVQESVERIDYSQDGSVKPPYSYAALIGMAMKGNQNKMTLSDIYKWIKHNFAYYKTADPSWQNSIRHNLSLNKCFLKVARSKDEPGKGGFWKLDPEYADSLVDGVFKKRRPARSAIPPPNKTKKNRKPISSQQQQQQQQHIQQLGIKVVVQPTQAAFMPPPTNKPPPRTTVYLSNGSCIEVDGEVVDDGSSQKDDLAWSTLIAEEVTDDPWSCRTQELVTDLRQTGDPSTYPTTIPATTANNTTTDATTLIQVPHHHHHHQQHHLHNQHFQINEHHHHHQHHHQQQQHHHHHPQIITITATTNTNNSTSTPSLPSLELSPASLGVEEDLFTSPEYSEASNDDGDSFTSTLDINGTNWSKGGGGGYVEQLPSMNTLCSSLTPLVPMEPAPVLPSTAPVLVQDAHACWGPDTNWDEAKTLSLLDANLDLENLIDLDVL